MAFGNVFLVHVGAEQVWGLRLEQGLDFQSVICDSVLVFVLLFLTSPGYHFVVSSDTTLNYQES